MTAIELLMAAAIGLTLTISFASLYVSQLTLTKLSQQRTDWLSDANTAAMFLSNETNCENLFKGVVLQRGFQKELDVDLVGGNLLQKSKPDETISASLLMSTAHPKWARLELKFSEQKAKLTTGIPLFVDLTPDGAIDRCASRPLQPTFQELCESP